MPASIHFVEKMARDFYVVDFSPVERYSYTDILVNIYSLINAFRGVTTLINVVCVIPCSEPTVSSMAWHNNFAFLCSQF